MSTAKQRLCSKLGISESSLKGGNIFSPDKTNKNVANDIITTKGEKAIKYFSSANITKKASGSAVSAYQNYRIDILVPNSDPPKPLVTQDCNKNLPNRLSTSNYITSSPFKSNKDLSSTLGSSKRSCANNSHLDNLSYKIKLSNVEVYSPIVKAKAKRETELTGKYFTFHIF